MSRIVVTDLLYGVAAASADVNATLSSWVAACATGALAANNVRNEGIDRRTLSSGNRAIYSAGQGATPFYASGTSSGAVNQPAPNYVVINCGGSVQTGATAPVSGDEIIVTGSTTFYSNSLATVNNTRVDVTLQYSEDGGATWNNLTETSQRFRFRGALASYLIGTATVIHHASSTGTPRRYRMAFTADPGTVFFDNAVIYVEDYAR